MAADPKEPPTNWMALALAVFPNSRPLTRAERAEFEAVVYRETTPLEFVDDARPPAPRDP
jgi:hypothetical protein